MSSNIIYQRIEKNMEKNVNINFSCGGNSKWIEFINRTKCMWINAIDVILPQLSGEGTQTEIIT